MSSLFSQFRQRYRVTARFHSTSNFTAIGGGLEGAHGYQEFMGEYAGATFNDGLYRIHPLDRRAKWNALISDAFPGHAGHFGAFAYDWMGRQFALDAQRTEGGEPLVLLFDPGFGEALEIPTTFLEFHEKELIEHSDAALAETVFKEWLETGHLPPKPSECVGYRILPILGGKDDLENNEIGDLEVYWSLSAQTLSQTRPLATGTPIGHGKID